MSPFVKIALGQVSPVSADATPNVDNLLLPVEQNLLKAAEYIKKAKAEGADVLVLPEYFVQGIVEGKEYLVHPADHALEYLKALCKAYEVALVFTTVEPQNVLKALGPASSPFTHLPIASNINLLEPNLEVRQAWREFLEAEYPHCFGKPSKLDKLLSPEESHPPTPSIENSGQPESLLAHAQAVLSNVVGQASSVVTSALGSTKKEGERPLNMSNTAYYISGEGEVVGRYRKKNLWIPERDYLVAGEADHQIFDTPWGKAGMLICWDLSRPEAAAKLAAAGADIIFAPTYWMGFDSEPGIKPHSPPANYERDLLRSLAYARAFETETALIMLNAGGPTSEGFIGGSGLWMPFKGLVAEVADEEGLVMAEVDLGVLKDSRNTYQIRQDRCGKIGSM